MPDENGPFPVTYEPTTGSIRMDGKYVGHCATVVEADDLLLALGWITLDWQISTDGTVYTTRARRP